MDRTVQMNHAAFRTGRAAGVALILAAAAFPVAVGAQAAERLTVEDARAFLE